MFLREFPAIVNSFSLVNLHSCWFLYVNCYSPITFSPLFLYLKHLFSYCVVFICIWVSFPPLYHELLEGKVCIWLRLGLFTMRPRRHVWYISSYSFSWIQIEDVFEEMERTKHRMGVIMWLYCFFPFNYIFLLTVDIL